MPCCLPGVGWHPTADRVGVVDSGGPHLAGVFGKTVSAGYAQPHFFDTELMCAAQQYPHGFPATSGSENHQVAVWLCGATDWPRECLGLPIEDDARYGGWCGIE